MSHALRYWDEKNFAEAIHYFQLAAKAGNREALYQVGVWHLNLKTHEKLQTNVMDEAFQNIYWAAILGHEKALEDLHSFSGIGDNAKTLLDSLALNKELKLRVQLIGSYYLGRLYAYDIGIRGKENFDKKEQEKAAVYGKAILNRAIEKIDNRFKFAKLKILYRMIELYTEPKVYTDCDKIFDEVQYFEAEQNSAEAMLALGEYCLASKKLVNAAKYFEKAGRLGIKEAKLAHAILLVSNPELSNPELSNPELSNPELSNPELSEEDQKIAWEVIDNCKLDGNPQAIFFKARYLFQKENSPKEKAEGLKLLKELGDMYKYLPNVHRERNGYGRGLSISTELFAKEIVYANYLIGDMYIQQQNNLKAKEYLERPSQRLHANSRTLLCTIGYCPKGEF